MVFVETIPRDSFPSAYSASGARYAKLLPIPVPASTISCSEWLIALSIASAISVCSCLTSYPCIALAIGPFLSKISAM